MTPAKRAANGAAMALALGLAAAHVLAKVEARPATSDYTYTIQRGDTLSVFARAFLAGPAATRAVQRLNHIANPRRMATGKVLHIPRALLRDAPTQASVASFAGPVTLAEHGQSLPAHTGLMLGEGAEIATGRNAFVTLRLSDGSAVSLPSQSRLRLARLRRVLLTGSIERDLMLEQGRVESRVTPMHDANSNFRVTTPITVSAVRGTRFRVAYRPESASAALSVVEGQVAVAHGIDDAPAPPAPTLAPAGFGIASTPRGDSGPLALLPAPALLNPGKVQTAEELHFALGPLPGAQSYHVQLAHDAGALDVLAEATAATPDFTLPSVPAGSYFLRVTALDDHGLEGLPDTFSFERLRNGIAASAAASGTGHERRYRFAWASMADDTPHFRFRLLRQGGDTPPLVDEAGLTGTSLTLTNLPPGEYAWQVASLVFAHGRPIEDWTPPQRLHIFAEH